MWCSRDIEHANYVIVTTPDPATRAAVVEMVRSLSSTAKILVRAHYVSERDTLQVHHATAACYEEEEVAVRLAQMILGEIGTSGPQIDRESRRIRGEIGHGVKA
jgi:monovalent cation:H+ antiporter-2, CPA2 family